MVTTYKSFLLCAFIAALFHTCSALFYTNSKENDYPRIGKRYLRLTSIMKAPVDWYPRNKVSEPYWKPEAESEMDSFMWRPLMAAIQGRNKVAVDPGIVTGESLMKKIRFSKPSTYNDRRAQMSRILKQQFDSLEEADLLPTF